MRHTLLLNSSRFVDSSMARAHHSSSPQTAYGGAPASAMFATHARYKRESYRGSEFAPKILNEAGIRVVMKSDHPVLNSRHLVFEAQQAHYYGLPEEVRALGIHVAAGGLTTDAGRHVLRHVHPGECHGTGE
jgi:imidazolonepropionase-like amidohydrolase